MYAIVETGGKQYKVAKNDIILVEKSINPKVGGEVKLANVLLLKDGDSVSVGSPNVKGAFVICEMLGNVRRDKVVSFKYKKRKSEKKKIGHRQEALKLKVKEITKG